MTSLTRCSPWLCAAALLTPGALAWAQAAPPRPQIVFALGNSESMDGTLSGAIMTGSGSLPSDRSSLSNSASPLLYTVPPGFAPPMQAANAAGQAPYTVSSGGRLYDNGASRLNVAKAGMLNVLGQYLPTMDFALATYQTSGVSLYTTWVYHMSPPGGFTFASVQAPGQRYVANPCYAPGGATLSANVSTDCNAIKAQFGAGAVLGNPYMAIGASSDDASINDVLYAGGLESTFLDYGGTYAASGPQKGAPIDSSASPPTTPYTRFTLANYNAGGILVGYNNSAPTSNTAKVTSPTNAGYVPYAPQVLYAQRGFGYGGSQSPSGGNAAVSMTNLGGNPSTAAVNASLALFATQLAPETNSTATAEVKSAAGQAATAGLMAGAGQMLGKLTAGCAGQYVILVSDGLPTMDLAGASWPPLGSAAGQGYGVYATFAGLPANANYGMKDGSTFAGMAVGSLVTDPAKTNDQALIDTITTITALNAKGIKTYVIGLGAGVDPTQNPAANAALNAMAIAGGTGQQYPASDIASFNAALNSIAAQIFSAIQVTAPVAPSLTSAGSLVYIPTSNNASGAIGGHLQAFQTNAGTPTGTALWDAGDATHMPVAQRQQLIYSTAAAPAGQPPGAGNAVLLKNLGTPGNAQYDANAFALGTPSTCVPNIATILAYTFNPSFNTAGDTGSTGVAGLPTGVAGCSYLAGRQLNWMLGSFSANDFMQYLGPPGAVGLLGMSGYVGFAQNNAGRQSLVLMSSNDGLLYAVDAATGKLAWGWMPRPFVAQLKNYTALQTQQLLDGKFVVTDAADVNISASPDASHWASYVVGTAQGGAYHYALKLASNAAASATNAPAPVAQAWGIAVAGGSSPQFQAPLIINTAGGQFAVFTVNTTTGGATTSTLYELNVATGQPATGNVLSAALPFVANSSMTFDSLTGTLWIGDNAGGVWNLNITGTAPTDVSGAIKQATTSPADPVNYVGYTEVGGLAYAWAATKNEITTFALSGAVSQIAWASSGGSAPSGYTWGGTALQPVASSVVMPLQGSGQVSAAPVFVNGVLVVPVYVPPSGATCGPGTGFYDLFDLASGALPKIPIRYRNAAVTNGIVSLGTGVPLSPTTSVSGSGVLLYPATNNPGNGSSSPNPPIQFGGMTINKPVGWWQR